MGFLSACEWLGLISQLVSVLTLGYTGKCSMECAAVGEPKINEEHFLGLAVKNLTYN